MDGNFFSQVKGRSSKTKHSSALNRYEDSNRDKPNEEVDTYLEPPVVVPQEFSKTRDDKLIEQSAVLKRLQGLMEDVRVKEDS